MDIIWDGFCVARKQYECDASETVMLFKNQGLYSFAEYRHIVKARKAGFRINPGDRYYKQYVKDDVFFTYRAIPAMHEILCNHDLFVLGA